MIENDDLLALSLLRFWLASGLNGQAALWQLDHFCLRLLVYTPPHDRDRDQALRRLIEMLEAFSLQRLCRCLQLPVPANQAPVLAELGFKDQTKTASSWQPQLKAGYNVFIKEFSPRLPPAQE